ncbi:MAG: sugar-binding protein [Phycisphaerae bacterium]
MRLFNKVLVVLIVIGSGMPAFAERQQMVPLWTNQGPAIDGRLDEACWRKAREVSLSPMREMDRDIPGTTVRCVYTRDAVYFGFTCSEPQTKKLKTGSSGLGDPFQYDAVELFLDTDTDKTSYLQLGVSAGGTYMTFFCPTPGNSQPMAGEWSIKSHVGNDGYSLEIRMPFSQFPVSQQKLAPTWNVGIARYQRLDLLQPRYAVWKGYLMEGLHHKPATWGDMGPFEVNFGGVKERIDSKTGPGGWEYPFGLPPVYRANLPKELDPSLAWIKTERLRIAWSWLTHARMSSREPQFRHTFQDVVNVIAASGFNVIIPNETGKTKDRTPMDFWCNLEGMVHVRLAGVHTMFNVGYIWTKWSDPAINFRWYVSGEGKMDSTAICPLEPYPWRENLVHPTLDALEEAKRLNIPDLFFGVMFDMEPQAGVHDYCFCDVCWKTYAESRPGVKTTLSAVNRKKWLLLNNKLDDYKSWQRRAVTELLRRELAPVRAKVPVLVFGFYPYHYQMSWITEAVLDGVSTRQAPGIAMDDQTYWTGWTGKPGYVEQVRQGTIKMLGYEPFYLASIAYCSPERNTDGSASYPTYTYERAGREHYLMCRAAIGNICWGGTRDASKDLLADQKPYYVEGFAKAHRLLEKDGVIDRAVPKPPTGKEKARLEKALATLQQERPRYEKMEEAIQRQKAKKATQSKPQAASNLQTSLPEKAKPAKSTGSKTGRSKVLDLYGGFDGSKLLQGWETMGAEASYRIVPRGNTKGQCLAVTARNVRYAGSGIKIDPMAAWEPDKDCRLSLEVCGGAGENRVVGFCLWARVHATDAAGKVYQFVYFIEHMGSSEWEHLMRKEVCGWNVRGKTIYGREYSMENIVGPDANTYCQWLGTYPRSLQISADYVQPDVWVKIKVNLADAFKAPHAPKVSEPLILTSLEIYNYMHDRTDWKVDNVQLAGNGVRDMVVN